MEIVWLILYFVINVMEADGLSLATTVNVIVSLHHNFHSGCVFLLFGDGETENKLHVFLLEKILTAKNVFVSSAHYSSFDTTIKRYSYGRNKPLFVVTSSDGWTRSLLTEVSKGSGMKDALWLMFLEDNVVLEDIFGGIFIPFNSEFMLAISKQHLVDLIELYHISPSYPLKTYNFGNWSEERGFQWCGLFLYDRRRSLDGYVMRAGYKYSDRIVREDFINNKIDRRNGVNIFFSRVWLLLECMMNFTTKYHRPTDNSWGALMSNGSWSGMIGMMLKKEIDVVVDAFLVTASRQSVIDFMTTLISTKSEIFIRRPTEVKYNWTDILKPFSTMLWVALILSIFTLGAFLCGLYRIRSQFIQTNLEEKFQYSLLDGIFSVFASFCQQGQSTTPLSIPCRVVYVTSYLMGVVLLASYSASLISYLTNQRLVLPFTNLQGLLKVGTYRLGVIDNSAQLNYFDNSSDLLMNKIYKALLLPHIRDLPKTEAEGLRRICDEHKYAFMTPFATPRSRYSGLKCGVLGIEKASIPGSLTMPIAKGHPFLGLINHNLEKLRYNGLISRLYDIAWPRKERDLRYPWESVNEDVVKPMFTLLAAGYFLAVTVLLLELYLLRVVHWYKKRYPRQRNIKENFIYVKRNNFSLTEYKY